MIASSQLRLAAGLATLFASAHTSASPLAIPFDFSKHAIGLNVTVKGTPLYVLLDTGVDPSVIDFKRAEKLGLPIDRKSGGQGDGEGSDNATSFPSTIKTLVVGGRLFGDVEALTLDMQTLSKGYGRSVDGVLGYSFLKNKIVLVDYPASKLTILANAKEAEADTRLCRNHYSTPLRSLPDDQIPVISEFRFGDATAPITLDTGSNRGISLYQVALELKGVRGALKVTGKAKGAGARGNFTSDTATLNVPVGFGPFRLPAGETVTVMSTKGSAENRVANIGNMTFAAMKLKLLLDYPGKKISFYGDCTP